MPSNENRQRDTFFLTGLETLPDSHFEDKNEICAICHDSRIDSTKATAVVKIKICPHVYHQQCLKDWLISLGQRGGTCPICRKSLYPTCRIPLSSQRLFPPAQVPVRMAQFREISARARESRAQTHEDTPQGREDHRLANTADVEIASTPEEIASESDSESDSDPLRGTIAPSQRHYSMREDQTSNLDIDLSVEEDSSESDSDPFSGIIAPSQRHYGIREDQPSNLDIDLSVEEDDSEIDSDFSL